MVSKKQWGLQQPRRGLFILLVSLLVAFGISSVWTPDVLQGAFFAFALCLVPIFVVMGLFRNGWPAEKLEQPARGILLLLLAMIIGIITFMWIKLAIGGGAVSPITNIYGITVVTIIVVSGPLFGFWPFAGRFSLPFAGIWWFISVYVIGFILFRIFYNFEFMSGAPFYNAAIDPKGMFMAVSPLTVVVMGLPFAFVFLHLGMWPFSKLKQPWLGIATCATTWILSGIMYLITTSALGYGVAEAQVKFGVFGVFGMMIGLMIFETWPGRAIPNPLGGLVNILLGIVLSIAMFFMVRSFGLWAFPGSPDLVGDGLYNWMATVALGVCFPFFAMYTTMFQS